jgi:alpha-beta hydrolase superfamily lysophospholipase
MGQNDDPPRLIFPLCCKNILGGIKLPLMTAVTFDMEEIRYSDGYRGAARWWHGGGRGAVLYMHGIQSHGGWFEESAGALAEAGFDVLLADRRGSGLNQQKRGDVDDFQRWLDDQIELVDLLRDKTGEKRVHLMGVSWGGKLVMGLAKRVPEKIASLTLIAPGIFPAVDVSAWEKVQIGLAAAVRSKKTFPIPLNEPELFTENPVRQAFIRDDELKLPRVTGNFLYQSRRLDFFVRQMPCRLTIPMKLFLAGREKIIDNQATLNYFRGLRSGGVKEWAYYPQASHTLEFEADNRNFLSDLREWMEHAAGI